MRISDDSNVKWLFEQIQKNFDLLKEAYFEAKGLSTLPMFCGEYFEEVIEDIATSLGCSNVLLDSSVKCIIDEGVYLQRYRKEFSDEK